MPHALSRWAAVALLLALALGAAAQTKRRGASPSQPPAADPVPEGDEPTYRDDAGDAGRNGNEVSLYSREEKIAYYEVELNQAREQETGPAMQEMLQRQRDVAAVRGNQGWFTNAAEKESLRVAEERLRAAQMQVERAKSREVAVLKKLKPLYGLVSQEFFHEQRDSISGSLKKVNELAYNQAWYSSLFEMGRRESLTDVIVGFFMQWLMSYVIMYPFAVLYYAVWVLPWSIYDYSSTYGDVFTGSLMFAGWLLVMCLPLIALFVGGRYLVKHYGPYMAKMAEENRRRQQARQAHRAQMYQQVGGMGGARPQGANPYAGRGY